jgi:hypothetical protein
MKMTKPQIHGSEHSEPIVQTEQNLRERLKQLMGDDALGLIDLELPSSTSQNEAREKHNARTARYKRAKALDLAPDSEAIRQAASNILFTLLLTNHLASKTILNSTVGELEEAGYNREQSEAALMRLLASHQQLRTAWQTRSRQKLGRAVIKQLRIVAKQRQSTAPGEVTG